MNEISPLLRQYANFLLSTQLDTISRDLTNKIQKHPLNSIKLLNLSEEEVFQLFRNYLEHILLTPIIQKSNTSGLIEKAHQWKREGINKKIKLYDLLRINHLFKLSFIQLLEKHDSHQKDIIKIILEIESFFNIYENQIIDNFEEAFTLEKSDRLKKTEAQLYNILKELPETEGALKEIIQYLERELKKKTSELSISEERFDLVSKATKDVMWDWDLSTDAIWWNEGFKTIFGYSDEEIEPGIKAWYNWIHPEDRERIVKSLHDTIDKGEKKWSERYQFQRKDGSYALVLDRGYAIHDPTGKPFRMVGTITDITESQEAKKALEASEERLRVALKSAEMGVWNYNPQTGETNWDERCKELFGLSPENEVNYQLFLTLLHPDDREKTDKAVQRSLDLRSGGEYDVEYRVVISNKQERWIRAKGKAFFNENKEAVRFTGTVIDVTDIKKSEEELLAITNKLSERENQLKIITNILPAFISYVDKNEICQYANDSFLEMNNISGKVKHRHIKEILGEQIYKKRKQCIQRTLKGESFSFDDIISLKDGSKINVLMKYIPDKDKQGNIRGFVTMGINLTDRIRYEKTLKKKNEELYKINADLDNFIYTASHDLKAPVSNIEGLIHVLEDSIIESDQANQETNEIIDMVKKSITRFQETIFELTEISKIQKEVDMDMKEIDVHDQIKELLLELKQLITESRAEIKINTIECPILQYSKVNFRSILYNLVTNSIKYHSPERAPIVEIRVEQRENYCVLEVKDNGIGIREDQQEKAFGMFKRINTDVEGSGVGLYIVKRIVENSGGKIELESKVGEGSLFRIFIKT